MRQRMWAIVLAGLAAAAPVRTLGAETPSLELDSFFRLGAILEDRNGDEIADFVNVRIVVPEASSPSDIAGAAEIAARLGYETTATDLPLVVTDSRIDAAQVRQPLILIGRNNRWVTALLNESKLALSDLNASQGEAILVLSPFGAGDALVILGADEAGTLAAARAVASRMPFVGKIGGARFTTVESDIESYLSEKGAPPVASPRSTRLAADASFDTMRVLVEVALSSRQHVRAAEGALQSLVRAHQQGQSREVLSYPGLQSLEVELSADGETRSVVLPGSAAPEAVMAAPPGKAGTKALDLSTLYTIEGLFEDTNDDQIADRTATTLVLGEGSARPAAGWLATRLGLETAGIQLPLTQKAARLQDVAEIGHPVLIATHGALIEPIRAQGKLRGGALGSGEGLVQVVPDAIGTTTAVVVTGGDEAGLDAALEYASQRLPHLSERGKDRPTLGDVVEEARTFLAARSAAGQAAAAVYKLDRLVADLVGKDLELLEAQVFIHETTPELGQFLQQRLRSKLDAENLSVEVASLNIHDSVTLHEETVEFPWEVDDFWNLFREKLLPRVRSRSKVELNVRISESPKVRQQLEQEVRSELERKASRGTVDVHVLSSYKTGYSWLTEVVGPAIEGKTIGKIQIRFAELKPEKWQGAYSKIRWLLELYPVDEVLARDLGIPVSAVEFEMKPAESPTYDVRVTDEQGVELYQDSFDAKYVLRPLFDLLPDYDQAHVTTGWLTASVDGEPVVDERIVTDIEKFWDHYQQQTLPRVWERVMELYEGKPRARYAPYFGELRVDLSMSEPNFRIGIDEEIVSTLDAVHEDIYFGTIAFFDVMGQLMSGEKLWHPGRILPYMRPAEEGGPGKATIRFTGKPAGYPQVRVRFQERGGEPEERKLEIAPVDIEAPRAVAVTMRHGSDRLETVFLECKVDTERDEREALLLRASEEDVDRLILSQDQAVAMVEALAELQRRGLFVEAFGYSSLQKLGFVFRVGDAEASASLTSTGKKPLANIKALAEGYRFQGESIVHWDEPIPPEEAEQMVAKLDTFPEFTAYHAGRSFLGRDIWAMDVMLPVEASHWSQAKASTVKPVLIISGRQHANEVSSTSHILRLAERIATEDEYKRYLDRVNVVLHPITNPDGAALAYEFYQTTPDFILHAGYLGALGLDMTVQQWETDPIYPEAKVRTKLWRTWLPDIFLNPHGYPKHEWVQYFFGYPAWVRARFPTDHAWAGPRGWYTSMSYVEDPKYPHHKEVALALRNYVVEGIRTEPEVMAMNERMYARYDRYGGKFDPESFKRDYTRGVRIYQALKGVKPDPTANDFGVRYPNVTVKFWGTEAPDETAYGDWMKVVAAAGFQFDLANLKYLYDSDFEVERTHERFGETVRFATIRPRPPRPGKRTEPTPSMRH